MDDSVNIITLVGSVYLEKKNFGFSWDVLIGKPNLTRLFIMSRIRSNYTYLNPTKVSKDSIQAYTDSVSLKNIEVGYAEQFDYKELDTRRITDFAVFARQIAYQFDYGFSVFIDAYDWGPLVEPFKQSGIEAKRFKLI